MHAAWLCWMTFSPDAMATKGYSSYRGRNKAKKIALIIGLVLILLAAVGFLIIQNYLVYDDAGKAHWEFPFMQHEDVQDREPTIDPNDVEIQREEPVSKVGKDLDVIQAQELPLWCLSDDPTWLLEGTPKYVVVHTKTEDGSLAYASKVAAPDAVLKGGESTLTRLHTILDSKHQAVAYMSCLCDNSYAYAMPEKAALCNEDGSLWWDNYGRYWLDPAKKDTQNYVKALCQECVTLGFDEIVLDNFGYPADWQGKANRTEVLTQFIAALREELPEGTRISVVLHEMPNAQNGLSAELLDTVFDRIYTDSNMDLAALKKALPKEFDAATRLVPTVWEAAESGSYMMATNY